jgi:pyruvate/2-oxoglutarate dehydrogenase complex dihydrolipoamide dehydrogenase (E3) component
MIGWARQLIADPQTPNKLKAGRPDLVRSCIACNDACTYQTAQEKGIRCVHNPSAGRERQYNERTLVPASQARRVAVVGGGPAGLKVAEIAARRGHKVTLLERSQELGGQVNLAARQPEHAIVGEVTAHLETQLGELGVEVRRGFHATPETLRALAADAIVVATGSEPNLPKVGSDDSKRSRALGLHALPDIAGLELPFVVSCDDVLSGAVQPRGKVVVVDGNGHWEAAGTAEFLADLGCEVELIASHGLVGEDLDGGARALFHRRAAIKKMRLRTGCVLLEIGERRVKFGAAFSSGNDAGWGKYVLIPSDEEWIEEVDWVVPIIGRRSRADLFLELESSPDFKDVEILRVGDCVAPRLIQSVIMEAFDLARAL